MPQYGFFFDQSRCSGCRACTVACKNWNSLPPGPLKYLRIYEYEKGPFPNCRIHFQWIPCYHCEAPCCVSVCPCEALYKEEKYGAVLVDNEKCDGCRRCYDACPYGSLVFENDELGVKAEKCTMCIDRLDQGLKPVCVLSCSCRALDFDLLSHLAMRYGNKRDLEDMPESHIAKPAVIFKPHAAKRQLVTYNAERGLELMMKRDPLPAVYTSTSEIKEIPKGMIGRDKLVLKHGSGDDLMCYTRSDEG
ncbi:MAG TPA: 4Fe-4S dicluster domain-containing protein [Thermodesulfobacteriota bacterium]|nr:4Fe-4S dicluster domain-containing protein [Thermodesulfobacteriota bacterium]